MALAYLGLDRSLLKALYAELLKVLCIGCFEAMGFRKNTFFDEFRFWIFVKPITCWKFLWVL